jgi:alginate O-acetyltransferase complex protein AlgJ
VDAQVSMTPTPRRIEHVATVALFAALILVPGLGLVLGLDRVSISESEMRELASFPVWSWEPSALSTWPDAFQRYFEDHFALRNRLISIRASLLWHVLGTSSSETVIAGRNDWLFYADDGGIDDYLQTERFTMAELEDWRMMLERTNAWLKARGVRYLFLIAPDKQMIYPEYMPTTLRRMHPDYRADQLLAYLRAHSTVETVDVRPALIAAKPNELLYHHYDTHWNDRGALVAYRVIASRLAQWFPAIRPLERSDFQPSPSAPSGDRTTMLGLTDARKTALPGLVPRLGYSYQIVEPAMPDPYGEDGRMVSRGRSDLPRLLVFRDSFASRLIPYLAEHFSRAVFLWQNDFEPEVIDKEHPDVVIQEFVARHLVTYRAYPDGIPH